MLPYNIIKILTWALRIIVHGQEFGKRYKANLLRLGISSQKDGSHVLMLPELNTDNLLQLVLCAEIIPDKRITERKVN